MNQMFYCCENLYELDLSSFNTNNVTNINEIFSSCVHLSQLLINKKNFKKIKRKKFFSINQSLIKIVL